MVRHSLPIRDQAILPPGAADAPAWHVWRRMHPAAVPSRVPPPHPHPSRRHCANIRLPPNASPMHWWPMQTPKSGKSGPSSRTACRDIPESTGRPALARGGSEPRALCEGRRAGGRVRVKANTRGDSPCQHFNTIAGRRPHLGVAAVSSADERTSAQSCSPNPAQVCAHVWRCRRACRPARQAGRHLGQAR